MRSKKILMIFLGMVGLSFGYPQPQPVIWVGKSTVEKVKARYNLEIIHKEKKYILTREEVYRLRSGEKFKKIPPNAGKLEVKKHCFYAKRKDTRNQPKKLYCYIEYIKDLNTGWVIYRNHPNPDSIQKKIEEGINKIVNAPVKTESNVIPWSNQYRVIRLFSWTEL